VLDSEAPDVLATMLRHVLAKNAKLLDESIYFEMVDEIALVGGHDRSSDTPSEKSRTLPRSIQ